MAKPDQFSNLNMYGHREVFRRFNQGEKCSRRDFFRTATTGLVFLALGSSACDSGRREIPEIPKIELMELISNPTGYENIVIRTQGYPRYVGQKSYFLAYPDYDPVHGMSRLSYSQVVHTIHNLHVSSEPDSKFFVMTERRGGGYSSLPIMASPGTSHENLVAVQGIVKKRQDSNYEIQVHSANRVQ